MHCIKYPKICLSPWNHFGTGFCEVMPQHHPMLNHSSWLLYAPYCHKPMPCCVLYLSLSFCLFLTQPPAFPLPTEFLKPSILRISDKLSNYIPHLQPDPWADSSEQPSHGLTSTSGEWSECIYLMPATTHTHTHTPAFILCYRVDYDFVVEG